jgi:5-methyltetrahydropteroyltriglutamate--homocysteine methyltransferase
MVYPIATIKNYSHEQFLTDLINESEKDIRLCLESGADCVQIDFTEACFSFQIDPSGQLLRDFIRFNNRVLNRFRFSEQHRLGVHICLSLYYSHIFVDLFKIH